MKEFLFTYYKELIAAFCFLIEFILSIILIFKRSKKESSVMTYILRDLPVLIEQAESLFGAGNGAEKLRYVIDLVDRIFVRETGKVGSSSEMKFIRNAIEDILKTPTKK